MRRIFFSLAFFTFGVLMFGAIAQAGGSDDASVGEATIATTGDGRWISVNPVLEVPQQCKDANSSDPKCAHADSAPAPAPSASSDEADSSASPDASVPAAAPSIDASVADAGDSWSNPDASESYDTASMYAPPPSPSVIVVPVPVPAEPPPIYAYGPNPGGYAPLYTVAPGYYGNGYNRPMPGVAPNGTPMSVTKARREFSPSPLGPYIAGSPTGPAPHLTFPTH